MGVGFVVMCSQSVFSLCYLSQHSLNLWCQIFSATVLINCGGGESLWTATILRTVVWSKQGHAPCKIHLLLQNLFYVS